MIPTNKTQNVNLNNKKKEVIIDSKRIVLVTANIQIKIKVLINKILLKNNKAINKTIEKLHTIKVKIKDK